MFKKGDWVKLNKKYDMYSIYKHGMIGQITVVWNGGYIYHVKFIDVEDQGSFFNSELEPLKPAERELYL